MRIRAVPDRQAMSPAGADLAERVARGAPVRPVAGLVGAAAVSLAAAAILLAIIVAASPSAWHLLGAGRGLVDPERYPLFGYGLVLGTTIGQVVGWAGGSGLLWYLLTLAGRPPAWVTLRLAMTVVYLTLGAVPVLVYHVFFGGWLLGLPRAGLPEWLLEHHPDAHWLLVTAHPFIDLAPVPLGAAFLLLVWPFGTAVRTMALAQTGLALTAFLTSLAVALSLAIHSTLVHIRL